MLDQFVFDSEDNEALELIATDNGARLDTFISESLDITRSRASTLIEKGYAYDVNGTVYFRTRKFNEYGKLSKKNIDDLEAGHREIKVAGEENKEDPLDFVLWKPKKATMLYSGYPSMTRQQRWKI